MQFFCSSKCDTTTSKRFVQVSVERNSNYSDAMMFTEYIFHLLSRHLQVLLIESLKFVLVNSNC